MLKTSRLLRKNADKREKDKGLSSLEGCSMFAVKTVIIFRK